MPSTAMFRAWDGVLSNSYSIHNIGWDTGPVVHATTAKKIPSVDIHHNAQETYLPKQPSKPTFPLSTTKTPAASPTLITSPSASSSGGDVTDSSRNAHRSDNGYNLPSHSADTPLVEKHQERVAHSS
jgi:hypothetical protein